MIPASALEKVTRESDHVGPTSRGGKKVRWTRGAPHLPCAPSPDAVPLGSDGWRSERLVSIRGLACARPRLGESNRQCPAPLHRSPLHQSSPDGSNPRQQRRREASRRCGERGAGGAGEERPRHCPLPQSHWHPRPRDAVPAWPLSTSALASDSAADSARPDQGLLRPAPLCRAPASARTRVFLSAVLDLARLSAAVAITAP